MAKDGGERLLALGAGSRVFKLHLPLQEIAAALQEGVGALMRQAGLELMQLIMEDEVRQLAGERCQRRQDEQGYRWGREDGLVVVDGQKVQVQRPQVRSVDGQEQTLGSYELFRRGQPLDEALWDKLMLEISTRNYAKAVRRFAEAYGIGKPAVSAHFIRVSRRTVRDVAARGAILQQVVRYGKRPLRRTRNRHDNQLGA